MDTVQPRNSPSSQSMTQDNVVKAPFMMPTPDNLAGNESGETTLIGAPIPVNLDASYGLNIEASSENRSAKFKNGEGGPAFDPGAGAGQYQGK